jgi:N-dimethylarginine dimethylaminohydrolase
MNRMLLCPPDFYSIRYEINPWMNRQQNADAEEAAMQWQRLYDTLQSLGCAVELLSPQPDWPDMVFTANAGLVHGHQFISSRFRHAERQGETPTYDAWFVQHGYEVLTVPDDHAFEGEGDALWLGDTLVCGHGFRTDRETHAWLAGTLHCSVLSVKLVNPHFYHLDTCFCPLHEGTALWHPSAFNEEGRSMLRDHVSELITVPDEEALRFACNAVVLGLHVLIPAGCPHTCRRLEDRGFACHPLPMSEFIKAGGACKCLVLRLPANDASCWS